MPIHAEALRLHLDYTTWASARLLEAAAGLSPDELSRDFGTADKSVIGTLAHVFAADRIWMARIEGVPRKVYIAPEERDLAFLQSEWPQLLQRWRRWADGLTDETIAETASYRDLKDQPWTSPLWQIVLHVVNHGTHHRGQVSGFMRSLGKTPPPLDLIAYYRQLGLTAAS